MKRGKEKRRKKRTKRRRSKDDARGDLESDEDRSWEEFETWSGCEPYSRTRVRMVPDVPVSPSSVVTELCDVSSCCSACRNLTLLCVDSLWTFYLAKQLARHLPWACRSGHFFALHQQYVHVCDSLLAPHISWVFVIFLVSPLRPQLHCLIRRLMIEIRMVFRHFDSAQFAHFVYLSLLCVVYILSLFSPSLECLLWYSCLIFHSACKKRILWNSSPVFLKKACTLLYGYAGRDEVRRFTSESAPRP